MKNWGTILSTLAFAAAAMFLLWSTTKTYLQIEQMRNWVPHEAKLMDVQLDIDYGTDDDADSYVNIVSYEYQIAGKAYNGKRISFGYGRGNVDRYFEIHDKLKYAKRVNVWVDPNDSTESAMAQGWSDSAVFFAIFTLTWVLGIIGAILWELSYNNQLLKLWSKVFGGLAIATFFLMFLRLFLLAQNDIYSMKIEDNIIVTEYMNEEEISRAQLMERARKEAFSRAKFGQDTIRIRLEKDTFHVK
ncbi:MAG: DUF3592 domain-containing protein [Saprospiraceae bacterium]